MELYKVSRDTRIKVKGSVKTPLGSPEIKVGDELNFRSIDGMYSYCTTDKGQIVHLAAWADVEILK